MKTKFTCNTDPALNFNINTYEKNITIRTLITTMTYIKLIKEATAILCN